MFSSPVLRTLATMVTCVVFLLFIAFNIRAQQTTGSIKGTVTDQLEGLVTNATIVVKNARGAAQTVTTNSSGVYEIRSLPPGKYSLKASATGFTMAEEKQVVVKAGATTTLDLQLSIEALEQSVTVDNKGVSTDSDRNGDATVLRGRDLEALPNDPDALASALQAMAGPSQSENGAQVTVDGFSNGRVPPKEAIREVRVNQNPYSAENEYPGWGGIEIFTQPGSEKFHGGAAFNFNDESLNTRNPFAPRRAPYQQRALNLNLTGPIVKKRASFAFYAGRYASEANSVINANILDPVTLKPALFNQTLVTPQVSTYFSLRGDLKINKKHTLVGNFDFGSFHQDLQGVGGFALPSRAYRGSRNTYTLQLTETTVINEKTINETRLQISHGLFQQRAATNLPALNVAESFFGGGAQVGSASSQQDRIELQNFTSWSTGRHFLKVGGRLRNVRLKSISPSNFGGTYTFAGGGGPVLDANDQMIPGAATIQISSLERYRRTLVFQRLNLSAAEIRNLGGGATQFSIAGGNPEAGVNQSDVSLYLQDDWKLRPNFTISPGFRYENQTNIHSNSNLAPRIGFAWSPSLGSKKKPPVAIESKDAKSAAPAKPSMPGQSKTVIRGGIGIFYNRISEDLILQARRFNGLNQQQFVVTDPAVLDLFPAIPSITALNGFAQPQTRRFLSSGLAPDLSLRASVNLERQLSKDLRLSVSYSYAQTRRTMRTVNINAPLVGTFDPALPTSGSRPMGQSAGNILENEANGRSRFNSLNVGFNGKVAKVDFWTNYSLNHSRSTDNGTSGSPFDPYDFSNEWGRAGYDIRHRFFGGANYQTASGFGVSTFLIANSGAPFNIITGHDTNGDTFFSERPAFATDLNKPGVIMTPMGALDPNPVPGQRIIPRNFGRGPGFFSVNVGLSKIIKFGRAIPAKTPPAATSGNVVTTVGSQKPPAKPQVQRPYSLSFSVYASNALNHTNRGAPIGNMASPYFLKSNGNSAMFFFGPGGGGGSGGNRQVSVRVRLSF
jgi:hypothetical protein